MRFRNWGPIAVSAVTYTASTTTTAATSVWWETVGAEMTDLVKYKPKAEVIQPDRPPHAQAFDNWPDLYSDRIHQADSVAVAWAFRAGWDAALEYVMKGVQEDGM
jgi:hypothetical protein